MRTEEDDEFDRIDREQAMGWRKRQIEDKQEQGEPVAWIRGSGLEMLKLENGGVATVYASEGMSNYSTPLYTTPQQRKPLTDEQITALEYATDTLDFPQTVRAIEAAHGIKE